MGEKTNVFLQLAQSIRDSLSASGVSPLGQDLIIVLLGIVGAAVFMLTNVLVMIVMERRVAGFMQQRRGPNRNGPGGSLQSLYDALKMIGKEFFAPKNVDKWPYHLAAVLVFVPSILLLAVVPFGQGMIIADIDIGLFYYFAISGIGTIAVVMAGWGSNNKYALLGGMRSVAQMVSYEIPLLLSVLGIVMMTGSMRMSEIVTYQSKVWFIIPQFLGFFVYIIATTAELNRAPFDQTEGDQELAGGYFIEYSGLEFGMFYLAEYVNMMTASYLATSLFLGGGSAFFGLTFIPSWIWYIIKAYCFVFFFMWIRWTWPRMRIDHMMGFSWKVLIPVSLANILITGVGMYIFRAIGG